MLRKVLISFLFLLVQCSFAEDFEEIKNSSKAYNTGVVVVTKANSVHKRLEEGLKKSKRLLEPYKMKKNGKSEAECNNIKIYSSADDAVWEGCYNYNY
jgi:hypothetical protein